MFRLIADGDETAFEQLFNLYVSRIHKIIYPVVQSETVVKDIAQEVFMHLWLGRDKLPAVEEPQHWIFRIAFNQSFRYLKKRDLLRKTHEKMGIRQTAGDYSQETENTVNVAEVNRLIQEAIRKLPEQGRRIFELNRVTGKKPAEIAMELRISVQAVRNSLTRSGKSIKAHLARYGIIIPLFLLLLDRP
jgi:RNA polymerase sigma-70 factor (family 1)